MTLTEKELVARAKRCFATIERRRRDPRFARVIGRLRAAGYLTTNFPVEPCRDAIRVADALWVGDLEPRVLELLPALIIKTPSLFVDLQDLPTDLVEAVRALRRHETPPEFRGIAGKELQRWLPQVGRKGKTPSRLKAFRLGSPELLLLEQLSEALAVTETEVIRRALRELAARHPSLDDPAPGSRNARRRRVE